MKIVLLPFAGGNRHSYNFLDTYIQPPIQLIKCEYPGHGVRTREKLLLNIHEVVDDLFAYISNEIDEEEYIIYGHSMGGLIGYELSLKIAASGLRLPLKLIASGCSAPSVIRSKNIADLPGETFWQRILKYGGMDVEVVKHDSFREYFEEILRADFSTIDNYRYSSQEKLTIPFDIIYSPDDITSIDDVKKWDQETTGSVHLYMHEGNHFFIYNNPARLAYLLYRNFSINRMSF